MTHALTINPDGTTTVIVDFSDEGVTLTGETSVKGGEIDALHYLPIFESDLRRNFVDRFPLSPEPIPPEPIVGIGGILP